MDQFYCKAVLVDTKASPEGKEPAYVFCITKEVEDRAGEVVTADGWRMDDYLRNAVVLDSHNYSGIENILGRTVGLKRVEDEWHAEIVFNQSPKGKLAKMLVDSGDLRAVSVGFKSNRMEFPTGSNEGPIKHIDKTLLEISMVPVPMLQDALRVRNLEALQARRATMPPHTTAKAETDAQWDAEAELVQAEGAERLRLMHAWLDEEGDPETKSSYKLPHHSADGKVVWRGVAAAMAALLGASGDLIVPVGDRKAIYQHLERHYGQFGKTAPEFKTAAELAALGLEERKGLFWEGELPGHTKADADIPKEEQDVIDTIDDQLTALTSFDDEELVELSAELLDGLVECVDAYTEDQDKAGGHSGHGGAHASHGGGMGPKAKKAARNRVLGRLEGDRRGLLNEIKTIRTMKLGSAADSVRRDMIKGAQSQLAGVRKKMVSARAKYKGAKPMTIETKAGRRNSKADVAAMKEIMGRMAAMRDDMEGMMGMMQGLMGEEMAMDDDMMDEDEEGAKGTKTPDLEIDFDLSVFETFTQKGE